VHPDVETVRPEGQFIKIDQVRAITGKLALIPFEARKRVVILAHAERMNPQAANAFLKTLEEPPQDTLLVLCAERASALPETIVSRCVPVRFGLLPPDTARALWSREEGLSPEAAEFALRFAQGRLRPELPARAAHWLGLREELIGGLAGLPRPVRAGLSEAIGRWAASEDWRFVLEWLESWFRDLAVLGAGVEAGHLINADRRAALEAQRRWFTPERAGRCFRRVLAVREDIVAMNANKVLALEALWLGFRR
jgi:DNA polymerase-3 subunit delta'